MIRAAASGDIAAFIALQRRLEQGDEIFGYHADSDSDWSARTFAWTFVAVANDGRTLGFIYCEPRAYEGECVFPAGSRVLEIVELVVDVEARDRGIGRELVAKAHERARQDGFSHLRVYSASRRFDDVLRFYRSCGFTPWSMELTMPIE